MDTAETTPNWSDQYTTEELAAALELHALRLGRLAGWYEIAQEIDTAAKCIRDLAERNDRLASELAPLAGAAMEGLATLDEVKRTIRASVESLSKQP